MKKSKYLLGLALGLSTLTYAQNFGINTDGSDPDGDAILHIKNDAGSGLDSTLLRIENEKATKETGVQLYNSGQTGATAQWNMYIPGGTTDLRFKNNTSDHVTILNGGNVGIGTTTPETRLDVSGPYIGGGGFRGQIVAGDPAGGNSGAMSFRRSDGAETGFIGFYGATESHEFHIRATGGGNSINMSMNAGASQDNDRAFRVIRSGTWGTDTSLVVTHAGNVGIGTTDPAEKLHVVGDGLFTGNVTAACGVLICSDKRYKKDFNKIGNALNMISQVDGYTYNFRTNEFPNLNFDTTQQVGFIAQELQEVLPEAVHQNDSGYLSVDYGKVTPLLLMAIKEQQAIIEELKKENSELKEEASAANTTSAANTEKLKALEAKLNLLLNNMMVTAQE